jgi:hypothetical protein
MTRSIFDPTGGETEHSGSRNLGPDASEISHMPPGVVDGVVDCDEDDITIDMGGSTPPPSTPIGAPGGILTDIGELDAPQEPEAMDDPTALEEGQPSDDSDAPQE